MNKTIVSIEETTTDAKVHQFAEALISNRYKLVKVQFIKKDGSVRDMTIVPNNEWNKMNGIKTTKSGCKMIDTKVNNGMATVCELVGEGVFRPRTLNLNTIREFIIVK